MPPLAELPVEKEPEEVALGREGGGETLLSAVPELDVDLLEVVGAEGAVGACMELRGSYDEFLLAFSAAIESA
jgi:hypothetical protein